MPKMPTLGPQPKKSPLPGVIVIALLAGGVAGGGYWWKKHRAQAEASAEAERVAQQKAIEAAAVQAQVQLQAQKPPTPEEVLKKAGVKAISVTINGPLETAIVAAAGSEVGPALTQVVTRTLVWWVTVPGEVLRGDKLDVLYEERTNEEPLVHAVRFTSGQTGKTHEAYLYKAKENAYARYYEPDGTELELRLKDAPLDHYEQVTSRLRDGRRHKGVDFKTPVGTPVKATFDGVITRRNWNFRGNGNSLEVAGPNGMKALFLHLSELPKDVRVGMRVHKGQVLAESGNTGHSFAPHLHYQLMLGDEKVLDPFDKAPTFRRSMPTEEKTAFEGEVRRMQTLLSQAVAGK